MSLNKTYFFYIFIGFLGFLSYRFYRGRAAEQHQIALQACTAKLQELRHRSQQIKPVNLYPIKIGDRWGYKNGTGKIIIPPKFDRAEQFHEGRAIVFDYGGFQDGKVVAYLHKQESVPWGFLMPYGNPVPRVYGFVDCTGKESYEEFVWTLF